MNTERIAEQELDVLAKLFAPLDHFFVETVRGDNCWHGRCNCGYRTLGYADPDRAIAQLERWHLGKIAEGRQLSASLERAQSLREAL